MPRTLRRRTKIRSVTYLTAAFLLLAGTVIQQNAQLVQYRRLASNHYTHAFSELSASMNQMATGLEKQTCVTTPAQIAALGAEIYGQSQAAQQAIGELPYADVELEQTAAFVSKVGDYAQAVSRSAAANGGYSGDELENVKALAKASKTLAASLDALEGKLYSGDVELEDLEAVENRLSGVQSTGADTSESRFKTVETDFPELPTLIYDGPFSDSLQSKSARALEGLEEVSRAQARRAAAEFLEVNPNALTDNGEVAGDVPVWCFLLQGEKGTCTIQVTKTGGKVLNMLCSRGMWDATVSREEAVQKASAFLASRGYTGLVENYYSEANGSLTINFTAVQEDVLLYPDLIKVEVALDNGEIVGFEGENYLMHHVKREQLEPAITADQAKEAVSDALELLNVRLALIPTPGENEVLCWECTCQTEDGTHCMVYINAQTGAEEKILLLQEDETGTLVL